MAHFARIDENNIVRQIIVVNDEVLENKNFPESEILGISFCKSLYGDDTEWKQTSYNQSFRKKFAGDGMIYYPDLDEFDYPKEEEVTE